MHSSLLHIRQQLEKLPEILADEEGWRLSCITRNTESESFSIGHRCQGGTKAFLCINMWGVKLSGVYYAISQTCQECQDVIKIEVARDWRFFEATMHPITIWYLQ